MTTAFIHETAVVDDGAEIGEGTRVWHFCHVQTGARIGRDCVLGQNVYVAPGAVIGDRVHVQNNVSVYQGVVLEDEVFVGPSAVFTNVRFPRAGESRKDEYEETRIARGATIGANATVVCGVVVGRHATVGAGAVVTADVAEHALMVGVPARPVGWVCRCGERLAVERAGETTCDRCGDRYVLAGASGALRRLAR